MANNRMWLVCKKCKEKVLLMKYYPSTSWYIFHEELTNDFMEKHLHNADKGIGNTKWKLKFEYEG